MAKQQTNYNPTANSKFEPRISKDAIPEIVKKNPKGLTGKEYVLHLRDGSELKVPETNEMALNVQYWGATAVGIIAGISCSEIFAVIDTEGKRHDLINKA